MSEFAIVAIIVLAVVVLVVFGIVVLRRKQLLPPLEPIVATRRPTAKPNLNAKLRRGVHVNQPKPAPHQESAKDVLGRVEAKYPGKATRYTDGPIVRLVWETPNKERRVGEGPTTHLAALNLAQKLGVE